MAINLSSTINVNIQTVDSSGAADAGIQSFCNATPVESLYTFPTQYSQTAPYTWDAHTYTAVDGVDLPSGGTCSIIDESDSIQVESHSGCPYGNFFGTCYDYVIVGGDTDYGPSFGGNYTHNVNVLYTEPVVKGCTSPTACNFCVECNTECDAGNSTCCNEPNTQVDYTDTLCDDAGCDGDNTSTIYGPDGFGEFHCTDSDGANNSCCPDHNNSGLCDPGSSSLSSYDTCSNHNGYDGIDYWIPTEDTGDVEGCMDSNACNYNASATWNDGTCVGDATLGCGCLNGEQAPSPDTCCDGITYCEVDSTNPNIKRK